jgi:hypothetical protein
MEEKLGFGIRIIIEIGVQEDEDKNKNIKRSTRRGG